MKKMIKIETKFFFEIICPLLIFIPFSWGNIDIYPVFIIVVLLFSLRKIYLGNVVLGLSAATKILDYFDSVASLFYR